jgi:protein-tyrosine phosphatase
MQGIEADLIIPNLWQGSAPQPGEVLCQNGIKILVLCAIDYQPPSHAFPGVQVIHAPYDDDFDNPPDRETLSMVINAGTHVANALRLGSTCLVTCWAGKNRSGFVTAIALHKLLGISGMEAVQRIKAQRPIALENPQFLSCLSRVPKRTV